MRSISIIALAALPLVMPLRVVRAQSADATASVQVVGAGDATVVNIAGLDFGQRSIGSVVHSSDVPTAAQWSVTFNTAAEYGMSFTLPTVLTRSDGFDDQVGITFGPSSAHSPELVDQTGAPIAWDPGVGVGVTVPAAGASLNVFLGADNLGDGQGDVTVNLGGAFAATYTGIVTLTVAAL